MNKTKLGFPVIMMSALMYLLAWYGGAIATVVVAGYILMVEDDEQLKKVAKRAVVLFALFMGFPAFVNVAGDIVSWISDFFAPEAMLDSYEIYDLFIKIKLFFANIISIVEIIENIVFAVLIAMALKGKEAKIPVLDDVIAKYM